MKILLRVDAGDCVGLGHFFRSLSLAKQLEKKGHQVFFSYLKSDFWNSQIRKGFKYPTIELLPQKEEEKTLKFIFDKGINVYFADGSISFTQSFIKSLRKKVKVIFYQNMTESFRLADIHICPTPDARSAPSAVKIFNGLKYLIIQPSIEKVQAKEIKPGFNSIAVSAGGSDPSNTLLRLYEIFKDPIFSSFRITFYLGIDFLHKDKIPTHYAKNIFFQPFNHNEIIEQDVLVSAFGVSIYEFLYLGMPIISFGHKPRNAYVSDSLANDTAAILSLGESCTITLERLYSAVQLLSDYSTRKHFNSKGRNLLDLKGASRVVEIVENCLSASF